MRRLCLFALIFIVLAGLYWLLEGSGANRTGSGEDRHLCGFTPADAARITVTAPDTGTIVLRNTHGKWQVSQGDNTTYAADSSAVQTLLETLAALETGSMVSRNSGRHALYEVSPETGVRVEVVNRGNRALAHVLIGKNGPNIFSTYVRAANSDAVYLVDGILQGAASKTLEDWRDKKIFFFDPDHVVHYTVTGACSLALNKTNGTWLIGSENEPAHTAAVEQAVRTLATLGAAGFAEGSLEEFGLAKPERTVTAELKDGSSMTLLMGKDKNAFQQYAKTAGSDTVYVIEKHILGMLCPSMEELKNPATYAAKEESPAAPANPQPPTNR